MARLIGFPYAGGNASIFRHWVPRLGDEFDLQGIQFPGRGARHAEPPLTDFNQLVHEIADMFVERPSSIPMVFFGHSMGASVAYDVACELASRGAPRPDLLVLSGRAAPSCTSLATRSKHWSDDDMIDNLRRLQGTPQEVLDNPEMLALLMPVIRADYELLESWQLRNTIWEGHILALAGRQDSLAHMAEVAQWKQHTSGRFEMMDYPGGHFYIHEQRNRVVDDIVMSMRRLIVGC